jgi:hypothetical protein
VRNGVGEPFQLGVFIFNSSSCRWRSVTSRMMIITPRGTPRRVAQQRAVQFRHELRAVAARITRRSGLEFPSQRVAPSSLRRARRSPFH